MEKPSCFHFRIDSDSRLRPAAAAEPGVERPEGRVVVSSFSHPQAGQTGGGAGSAATHHHLEMQ
jgi:hypothetical protein